MLRKYLYKFIRMQDGSVVVIVAIFMTVLIGFSALALDIGFAYTKKAELQKDMDSIALAAVRELPANNISSTEWVNAKKIAIDYAAYNHINDLEESELSPVYENNDTSKRIIGITVEDNIEVNYNFAKIIGFKSGNVNSKSTAVLQQAEGVSGLLPLALPKTVVEYLTGETPPPEGKTLPNNITLKLGPQSLEDIDVTDVRSILDSEFDDLYYAVNNGADTSLKGKTGGWRGALNFTDDENYDGKYQTTMQSGGFGGLVSIEEEVFLNNGNMTINLKDSTKLQIGDIRPIPIIDYIDGILQVTGFASVKVIGFEDGNNSNNVNSSQIKLVEVQFINDDYVASGVGNKNIATNYYGVMAARLVELTN